MDLAISGLRKVYSKQAALHELDLTVREGEVLAVLGASGSGKSTLLGLIAGLLRPDGGEIRLGDRVLAGRRAFLPPEQRGISLVFQDFALWPHMTVFENVALGLRSRGMRGPSLQEEVEHWLSLVRLLPYAHRYPHALSGGQQQRVAIARAMAVRPGILLMDEPLGNLDTALREELLWDLGSLIRREHMTVLYVTHHPAEALTLADHILVLAEGRAVGYGTPRTLFERPADTRVARMLGEASFVTGTLTAAEGGMAVLETTAGGRIRGVPSVPLRPGQAAVALLRPSFFRVQGGEGPANLWSARLRRQVFQGAFWRVLADVEGLGPVETQLPHPVPDHFLLHLPPERVALLPPGPLPQAPWAEAVETPATADDLERQAL